jgi:hypothetical protein
MLKQTFKHRYNSPNKIKVTNTISLTLLTLMLTGLISFTNTAFVNASK